ncbi:hypothetical protein OROHE_013356 [Orobanche hederae]
MLAAKGMMRFLQKHQPVRQRFSCCVGMNIIYCEIRRLF